MEGAPSVIRKDGTFYLYSNRRVGVTERPGIVLATSTDLECGEVHGDNPVYAPNPELYSWPEPRHCRDYHVMPFEGDYLMLFAELTRRGLGCVGAIWSRDLVHWEDRGPMFLLDKAGQGYTLWEEVGYGIPESPFLLRHDGRWHLRVMVVVALSLLQRESDRLGFRLAATTSASLECVRLNRGFRDPTDTVWLARELLCFRSGPGEDGSERRAPRVA